MPSYLCPGGCAAGAQWIHYLPTGEGSPSILLKLGEMIHQQQEMTCHSMPCVSSFHRLPRAPNVTCCPLELMQPCTSGSGTWTASSSGESCFCGCYGSKSHLFSLTALAVVQFNRLRSQQSLCKGKPLSWQPTVSRQQPWTSQTGSNAHFCPEAWK